MSAGCMMAAQSIMPGDEYRVGTLVRNAVHDPACSIPDLVTLLRQRAAFAPDGRAYVFLAEGEYEQHLSYGQLDTQACHIAARLQALEMIGERALLLYPPGLDYIAAFFGCLYAGVIAVPAYPPSRHHLHRLKAIVQDAAPAVALTSGEWREKLVERYQESWGRNGIEWLATDGPVGGVLPWVSPVPGPESLAFLQYTSGSTGNPKGVMVSHGNLMANQQAIKEAFGHTAETIVVGWLPLYHDMGLIGNILQPLYLGSTAILMSPLVFLEKPVRWLKAISRYRAATSGGPNFAYELCIRKVTSEQKRELDLSCWTLAFNGSEPVRASTMERFANAFSQCGFRKESFFPCYGLAEATLFVTGGRLEAGDYRLEKSQEEHFPLNLQPCVSSLVPCGRPWTDHAVRIVDPKTGLPCSDGQEGEIWVSGPSVAQGYWNRKEGSERTFRARLETGGLSLEDLQSPVSSLQPEASFLRTGDLGFIDRGDLYITGRIKDLIILRGRNYYPQDLEQALEGVAALRPGCSAAFSVEQEGEEALVVIVELRREALRKHDAQTILAAMRQALAEICDGHVGELVLVPPSSVPKTSSGKIRRQACKKAYLAGQLKILGRSGETETPPPAPSSSIEDEAADLLRDALHVLTPVQRAPLITRFLRSKLAHLLRIPEANLAADTAMRSLGLDSLRAVELKHAVDNLLSIDAPLTLFLSDSSTREVADSLAERWGITISESEIRDSANEAPSPQVTDFEVRNLSHTQQAIWAVHHRELDSPMYNLQVALQVEGELDVQVFEQALGLLLERHEILRTVYRTVGDDVLQEVLPVRDLQDSFTVIEAMEWSECKLQQDLVFRATAPFDLALGPVLRVTVYRQASEKHGLLFCVHHIAVDLWSVMLLLEELRELYEAVSAGHPIKPIAVKTGYREFARWQRAYPNSAKGASAWEYWRDQLGGTLPVLALPTDYSPPAKPNYRGSSYALYLKSELTDGLRKVGEAHGATMFAILLAAYSVLLHRYTHQDDIIIGTASSGRCRAEFAGIVGNCVNPLAFRIFPAGGETFAVHLQKVKETLLDALEYQDFPFPVLVERLQPDRVSGYWPIFQTLFVYRTEQSGIAEDLAIVTLGEQGPKVDWGGWTIEPINLGERGETFDLTLTVAALGEGFLASFHYRSDLFAPETIAHMAGHFETLLEGIVENDESRLSELSLLRPSERRQLLIDWSSSRAVHPQEHCLHRLFEIQVQRIPGMEAVVWDNDRLTYAELNAEANRLAHHLRSRGVGPETRVALCVERSQAMVIGMIGILKAGGAYVPVDPHYPRERIEYLLEDSGTRILLIQAHFLERIPPLDNELICLDRDWDRIADHPKTDLPVPVDPDNVAYVIYTSGSTGRPKGVLVSHRNAVHSTSARFVYYPEAVGRFLLLSSFAFDSSVAGIFWSLGQGGTLVLPKEGIQKDPKCLAESIACQGISHLLCLPSLYGLLLEHAAQLGSLRTVVVAGEACPRDVAVRHLKQLPETRLYNEYGPTEGTVWSSVHEITTRDIETKRPIAIGRPTPGCGIYLLDAALSPVPVSVSGELYIGGAGVTRGYLNHPELTAERFLPNPFAGEGERLYKTGDLVRWRPDGDLEFLGRVDHQVKIRGFRIELGEIEAKLLEHSGVKEAVAMVREDVPGDKRLAAYVAPRLKYAPVIDGRVRYSLPNGMAIVHYEQGETDYLYRQIFEDQGYLRHGIHLRDGDCVFDVGANIGIFTLFTNHCCPNSRVYAFEPIPALCELLRLNAELYGANTTVVSCGLSNTSAIVPFTFYPKCSLMSGRYADREAEQQVVKSFIHNRDQRDLADLEQRIDSLVAGRLESETVYCPIRTLSDLIREFGVECIDLLKIDVERSELEVLQGIEVNDWAKIRQIVLEVEDSGGRLDRIATLLHVQGYAVATEQESLLRGTAICNVYATRAPSVVAVPPRAARYPALLAANDLRQFLEERLPDYMVPSAFVIMENLPLTPNGKIDRKALPAPDIGGQLTQRYEEPRNAIEETLAGIWKEVLRIEKVGIQDNFFELGGDSILSIQVASRAIDAGFDVSPAMIFDHPTIAGLSAVATTCAPEDTERRSEANDSSEREEMADSGSKKLTATDLPLAALTRDEFSKPSDDQGDIEDVYPLTPLQEGMLFHTLMEPGSGIYIMQDRFVMQGRIDPEVFRLAWQSVIDRHPVLRTSFVWENRAKPLQVVHKHALLPFEYQDWSRLSAVEEQRRLDELLAEELREGIDLTKPPLVRVRLLSVGDGRYRMVFTHHHIILDAWCNSIIFMEFKANYEALIGGRSVLQQSTRPFRDYIAWLHSQDSEKASDFWRTYLQGFSEPTPLVVDRNVAPDKRIGGSVRDALVFLSDEDTRALNGLAQRNQLTINTFVQAALALLFSRYSEKTEVVFGVTVAGRPVELSDVEAMLGLFINTVPLRVVVRPEQSVLEFLRELLKQNVTLRQYEFVSLTEIQALSEIPRGQELFRHMLAFENAPIDPSLRETKGSFYFVDVDVRTHTNYPITVMVIPGTKLHLQITYQEERFEAATIEWMLGHFRNLLEGMIRGPGRRVGDLAMLTELECQQIVTDWNRTEYPYPKPVDFVARFEAQVEWTPDATAIACQGASLTYRELNVRANRLAHALINLGVGPDILVALLNDRGIDFAVMMLGVFKAGGAYLPLDPAYPRARIKHIIETSRAALVMIGPSYSAYIREAVNEGNGPKPPVVGLGELEAGQGAERSPIPRGSPRNLAYVIYTSGSTGAPKGVMVERVGMLNNLLSKVSELNLSPRDVIAQTASQCFDISVWQFLTALLCGARVHVIPDAVVHDPQALLRKAAAEGITVLELVPSLIRTLLETQPVPQPRLRWLLPTGEAFPAELCRRWMERYPHARLLNAYGPAECSDDVAYHHVAAKPGETQTFVPIGRPVQNIRLYILDRCLQPVPVAVPGELCIAGIGMGRGYLTRPDLTAPVFIPAPFGNEPGGRLYRTGDLARYGPDGTIEFLGRIDHQVKIRGYRIELGEVETALVRHPQIKEAVAVAREGNSEDQHLVAYVVPRGRDDQGLAVVESLRNHLRKVLPDYMMPVAFVFLDALPLTPNGKVDRNALPAPDMNTHRVHEYVAPRNLTEEILVGIWEEVLGIERIGVRDNFFALGGHSLLAVQVLSRVRAAFGIEVPFRRLFESSTIEELAVLIEDILIEKLETVSEAEAQVSLTAVSPMQRMTNLG